ncbi:MAG: hypothetical protein AAF762_10265 [Pseudomonadota bacterium]
MLSDCDLSDPAAEEIADELLYLTGKALATECFEFFRPHFDLPQIIETLSGDRLIASERDLRMLFDDVCAEYRKKGVVNVVRSIVSSQFIDADTIGSTHVSHTIDRNGEAIGTPYPTYSILRRKSDGWKIVRSMVVLLHRPEIEAVFAPDDTEKTVR